jgi:chromosome segregation ATPase
VPIWTSIRRLWRVASASFQADRVLSSAELRVAEFVKESRHSARELKRIYRELQKVREDVELYEEHCRLGLEKLKSRIVSIVETSVEELESAELVQRQYNETVETLQSELRVLRDITVPGLVAANKLCLAELDSWTSVQVRRQVAALPVGEME